VDFFNSLRVDLTPELERYVDQILENILSQSTTNLTRTSSSRILFFHLKKKTIFIDSYLASCQLLRSHTPSESDNSTMFQLPLLNITHQQVELSSHRTTSALSNQSGTRGILKITAPSMSNLLTTFESEKNLTNSCQFITLFPLIHLTQSDRTVLINLEK
jgi:hypothetical protein